MAGYILKRLLLMIPTLFGIMVVTFIVIQFVPGGPVEQLISQMQRHSAAGESGGGTRVPVYRGDSGLDQERIDKLKALYGFDKPVHQRFFDMVANYATFNLGDSYFHHKSVLDLVISKLPVSITLGMWTFFIVYLTSIPLGIAKAARDEIGRAHV